MKPGVCFQFFYTLTFTLASMVSTVTKNSKFEECLKEENKHIKVNALILSLVSMEYMDISNVIDFNDGIILLKQSK